MKEVLFRGFQVYQLPSCAVASHQVSVVAAQLEIELQPFDKFILPPLAKSFAFLLKTPSFLLCASSELARTKNILAVASDLSQADLVDAQGVTLGQVQFQIIGRQGGKAEFKLEAKQGLWISGTTRADDEEPLYTSDVGGRFVQSVQEEGSAQDTLSQLNMLI